ncbi:MAG: phospholipase D-like domain-containing protein [Candidatus Woesearchaeota archaeon]
MRYYILLLLLVLSGCGVSEQGSVEVVICPECFEAYQGFVHCAFYSTHWPKETYLIDADNYAGVGIPISLRGYMHHKFCFTDTHAVFGSANPTQTGLGLNDNLVVRVESAVMASNFASEYDFLLGVGSGLFTQRWVFNGQEIEMLFCPRSGCEKRILELLVEAERSVVFLSFSFTSQPIGDALITLHESGLCVQGVVENRASRASYAQTPRLQEAGVGVVRVQTPGVMHHKAFLIDNTTAIIGSYNPSQNANVNNAETVVIIREEAVIAVLNEEFTRLSGAVACKRF